MPLISNTLRMPSAFGLAVVTGLLLLVAKKVYSLAKKRRRLERRTTLLKEWVHIGPAQPRIQYRKRKIRLPNL